MIEADQLPVRAQRYFLAAVATACNVRGRSDLYLWARGPFWAAFPHDIMLCSVQNAQGGVVLAECLHSNVLPSHLIADLCDTQSGFLVRLQRLCSDNGVRRVCLDIADNAAVEAPPPWAADLAAEWISLNLGPLWWIETGPLPGSHASSLAIVGPQLKENSDSWPLLPLMTGPLHLAMIRALCTAEAVIDVQGREVCELTERQMEIMRWVRMGKTNHEISSIMDISPFTVKNHIQTIYKKMSVHNRAQAVARSSGQW